MAKFGEPINPDDVNLPDLSFLDTTELAVNDEPPLVEASVVATEETVETAETAEEVKEEPTPKKPKLSFSKTAKNVKPDKSGQPATTSEDAASAPVAPQSQADLLRLKINQLTAEMAEIGPKIEKGHLAVKEALRLIEEYYRRIEEKEKDRIAALDKISQLENRSDWIAKEIERLKEQIAALIGQEAAMEKLNEIKARIALEHYDSTWYPTAEKLARIADGEEGVLCATEWQMEDIVHAVAAFLAGHDGLMNANVTGSGKTLESAAFIEILSKWAFRERFGRNPSILWMTAKTAVGETQKELALWNQHNKFWYLMQPTASQSIRNQMLEMVVNYGAVPIINYDMMTSTSYVREHQWDIVIVDEVQHFKGGANPNGPTKRFENMRALLGIQKGVFKDDWKRTIEVPTIQGEKSKQLPFILMLSATPVENKVEETWAYLHLFDPETFNSLNSYKNMFLGGYVKYDPMKILALLKGRFVRQDPQVVWKNRVSKDIITVKVDQTDAQRIGYQVLKDQVMLWVNSQDPKAKIPVQAIIAQLTRMRQWNLWPAGIEIEGQKVDLQESGKIDAAMELIEKFDNDNEPVVVFSAQFKEPLQALADRIVADGVGSREEIGFITGDRPQTRDQTIQDWKAGKTKFLLCTMKSAGISLNLGKSPKWTGGAHHAILLDKWYNPSTNSQARDRIWRNDSTEGVKIWELYGVDTVDAFIEKICDDKEGLFNDLIKHEVLAPSQTDWAKMLKELL